MSLGLLYEQYSHVQPIVQTAGMRKDPWSEQSLWVSVVLKLQRLPVGPVGYTFSWGRTDSFGSPERHGDPWRSMAVCQAASSLRLATGGKASRKAAKSSP